MDFKMLPLYMKIDLQRVYGNLKKGIEPSVEQLSNILILQSLNLDDLDLTDPF